jgi:uncharacterized protein DUF4154
VALLNPVGPAGPSRRSPRHGAPWLAWLLLLVLAGTQARAQPVPSREYQVKAVFLFNFAQFVDWPPAAFADAQAPLVIGVLGEDPFGNYLDEAVRGEKVGQRPLVVHRYQRVDDIGACHVLFISRSEAGQLEGIVAHLKDRSTLTVSDTDGSANRGVMIRFLNENNRIRLRINLQAVKVAGLTISSKLLRPAEIVNNEKD